MNTDRYKHSLFIRFALVGLLLFSVSGFFRPEAVQAGRLFDSRRGGFQTFRPSECMIDLPLGVKEGEQVVCGYVEVPLDHSNPEGATIELAVFIIRSRAANAAPDPLFLAQGGPGGSTIETYASLLLSNNDLAPDRDIVLFDQRGTKYSQPNLYCEEIDALIADTIEQDLTDEESQALSDQAVERCHARLSGGDNILLSDYNSFQNADDIETIRQALGYDQINLYGVSYGTLLAQHYMDRHPESLRSVILDAVVPRQTNFILNSAQTMNRSFSALFDACREDPACNKAYPDLEEVFFDTVKKLNETPARIPLTDQERSITYQNAVINGDTFMSGLFQMLYAGSLIPALPRMINDAQQGNFDFFSRIYSLLLFDRSMSIGMYYSVICAEDADFTPEDQDLAGIRPEIAKVEGDEPKNLLNICQFWKVDELGAHADDPVVSEIPTLLLSGNFDPITPPAYAEETAQTLPNAYLYVNPAGGHGQALDNPCANTLIREFLDDPARPPDMSCALDSSGPQFFTPKSTISFPQGLALANLEQPALIQFIILGLFLSFLLTAVLAIPLIWLIVWTRRRKQTRLARAAAAANAATGASLAEAPAYNMEAASLQPGPSSTLLSKLAGWLAFAAGPVLSLFLLGLTISLFKMAMDNNIMIFFGLPRTPLTLLMYTLPYLFALAAIGMIIASVHAWLKRHWTVWTRIYYTLLTISATACLLILLSWGVFTAIG